MFIILQMLSIHRNSESVSFSPYLRSCPAWWLCCLLHQTPLGNPSSALWQNWWLGSDHKGTRNRRGKEHLLKSTFSHFSKIKSPNRPVGFFTVALNMGNLVFTFIALDILRKQSWKTRNKGLALVELTLELGEPNARFAGPAMGDVVLGGCQRHLEDLRCSTLCCELFKKPFMCTSEFLFRKG